MHEELLELEDEKKTNPTEEYGQRIRTIHRAEKHRGPFYI